MELKEFITETLVQIQEGVEDAVERWSSAPRSMGAINPVWGEGPDNIGPDHVQKVEFDVAVTVTEKSGGKASIEVFSVKLGGELRKAPSRARPAGSNSASRSCRPCRWSTRPAGVQDIDPYLRNGRLPPELPEGRP